jgi:hypothetical protein
MPAKKKKKKTSVKVRDLKPTKDAKGGWNGFEKQSPPGVNPPPGGLKLGLKG